MRLLGLDVGTKTIGIAVSDPLGITAQAQETLRRDSVTSAIAHIREIADKFDVSEIVVGLPLNMDGRRGLRAEETCRFVERLSSESGISVRFWDERLTSAEANRILLQADVSRKKRKKVNDKIAAQLILQSYLDSRHTPGREEQDV